MAENQIVALCADDYGLSYGVSAGILEALDAGRLTAVSALVNGPRWPALGLELFRRGGDADIGLHFNLTLGRPLSSMPKFAPNGEFPPLSQVIRMAYGGRLPLDEIRAELDRQFDRFEAVMDRPPDHVDGHQHVHVLPGIRTALLDAMSARRLAGRTWIRDAGDGMHRILVRGANARKALSVLSLASGFRREARYRGFAVNDGFAGFSNFHPSFDYARIFQSYLRAPGRRHLIMCHPG
ncbi:MAG: ChbG/HpnK family deacetylase, partial [Methylocystis sp.]